MVAQASTMTDIGGEPLGVSELIVSSNGDVDTSTGELTGLNDYRGVTIEETTSVQQSNIEPETETEIVQEKDLTVEEEEQIVLETSKEEKELIIKEEIEKVEKEKQKLKEEEDEVISLEKEKEIEKLKSLEKIQDFDDAVEIKLDILEEEEEEEKEADFLSPYDDNPYDDEIKEY